MFFHPPPSCVLLHHWTASPAPFYFLREGLFKQDSLSSCLDLPKCQASEWNFLPTAKMIIRSNIVYLWKSRGNAEYTHCSLGCWEPHVARRYVLHEIEILIFLKLVFLIEITSFYLLPSHMKPYPQPNLTSSRVTGINRVRMKVLWEGPCIVGCLVCFSFLINLLMLLQNNQDI